MGNKLILTSLIAFLTTDLQMPAGESKTLPCCSAAEYPLFSCCRDDCDSWLHLFHPGDAALHAQGRRPLAPLCGSEAHTHLPRFTTVSCPGANLPGDAVRLHPGD